MTTTSKQWWQNAPNASHLCKEIVQSLACGQHTILHHQQPLPWPDEFQQQLDTLVRESDAEHTLKILSAQDLSEDLDGLGKYLLKKFCKPDLRSSFRPSMSYADFLASHKNGNTLGTTYLMISNVSDRQMKAWLPFVKEYEKKIGSDSGCTFLLTTTADNGYSKGIKLIDYDKAITDYDCLIFYLILAGNCTSCPTSLRQYLGELTNAIVGKNVELGAVCISQGNKFIENPQNFLQQLHDAEDSDCSILSDEAAINTDIWMTQVKMLFPRLEKFRQLFLERHKKEIQNLLPHQNTFGESVKDYHDVELGLIWHFCNVHGLHIPAPEYTELSAYRNARNHLSHIDQLSEDELRYFLN